MPVQWRIAAALAVIAVVGVVSIRFYRQKSAPPLSPKVESAAVPEKEIIVSGIVRAKNVVPVGAPIDGTLEAVDVIDNQDIFEGQLLGRIHNSQLELAQEQAKLEVDRLQTRVNSLEAQLIALRLEASRADADATNARVKFNQAEKNYQRQEMLLREGATPRLTFEKAEKEYQTLKAENDAVSEMARQASSKVDICIQNLEEARKLLSEKNEDLDDTQQQVLGTEIHAPVNGILVAHRAASGDSVTRDMKDLFQIAANITELQLVSNVSTDQASKLQVGQPTLIQLAEAIQPLAGTINSIQGTQVIVDFMSPDPAIRPGLSAQMRIRLEPVATSSLMPPRR